MRRLEGFNVASAPRRYTIATLAAMLSLIVVPTGAALQSQMVAHAAGDPNTLIMLDAQAASDLDPASDQIAASNNIQRNLYDQLVAFKGSSVSELEPMLATSWKSNANKSTWTFYLRHGVKFHTGRTMTAGDVRYSIARTITAGLSGSYLYSRFITKPATQIVVKDPYTIEFDLGSPQPLFAASLANEYVGSIVDSTELQKHVVKSDYGNAYAKEHDLGTGPYMLKDWQHGVQVTLTKFPQYWRGWQGKHFSTIIVRTVPETSTRREQLERGTADLAFDLTPQDEDALQKESGVKVTINFTTELQYMFMTEAGPLASPLARQAISYAFNYDAYIKAAYGDKYARRAYGPIPSVLLGYDKNMFHYQTDLNKAKQLLQQAGIQPGTTLTLYHANYPYYDIAAQILTAQLGQIGIVVKETSLDEATYSANYYYKTEPASQHPNLLPFSWWPDFNDPWDMAVNLIDSKFAGAAGANAGYYHNSTVDKLMDASKNADQQTLIRNFKTIQDITGRQDPPALWLAEPAQVTVLRSDVQGLTFNPLEIQTYYFYNFHR